MTDYSHVSWCDGTHDQWNQCIITRTLDCSSGPLVVSVTAIPCDNAYLDVEASAFETEEAAWLVVAIAELTPFLTQARLEVDCEAAGHDHGQDDDDEDLDDDEDDDVDCCTGCGQPNTDGLVGNGPDDWLCRSCCEARGLDWFTRRLGA